MDNSANKLSGWSYCPHQEKTSGLQGKQTVMDKYHLSIHSLSALEEFLPYPQQPISTLLRKKCNPKCKSTLKSTSMTSTKKYWPLETSINSIRIILSFKSPTTSIQTRKKMRCLSLVKKDTQFLRKNWMHALSYHKEKAFQLKEYRLTHIKSLITCFSV